MKIGLFFGTFNPIHIGHLIIGNHLVENSDLDALWFMVTPLNPHKNKKSLLADTHRLAMVRVAVDSYPKLQASDFEFKLSQPNYTVNTLALLEEEYPQHEFNLIMGEDNLKSFHKWKNHEVILENYHVFVYPRISNKNINPRFENHPKIHKINAPIIEISATAIRNAIKEKKEIRPLLPNDVWEYLDEMNFYK
ncbi:MAG TPA: nicotinate-nucleotide adenylyltransferase [Lutibacter sp.]|nr:nicotinate-nucleotide adenylyltransferase [Lutibacter sp.]